MNPINFDEASFEWRKNKKYLGNGLFTYLCNYIHSNGKYCKKIRTSFSNSIYSPNQYYYCKRHLHHKRPKLNHYDDDDAAVEEEEELPRIS